MNLLKQSELFKKVPDEEIKVLELLAREKIFSPGTTIFTQNTAAQKVYILNSGSVALKTTLANDLEITYEMITKRGDPFGWSTLVEPFQHMTTALCLEETKVLAFHGRDLKRTFPQHPFLGFKVMQNLCVLLARRLERTRRLLVGQI
jgi:CRP-like cAMP-binding protein